MYVRSLGKEGCGEMPIENRNLEVGTRLVANYKKQAYVCTVEAGEEGKTVFVLDGKAYSSPSAAGSAVMGGTACNGWRFWSVEGVEAPRSEKPAKREPKAKQPKAAKPKTTRKPRAKAFRLIEKVTPNEGDPEGSTRFWCHGCQKSFVSETEKPEACPQGHRADDPELTSAPAPEAVAAAVEA
jgi:hypothetical protein